MPSCPKCGFTFAWNGTRCGHCNYPDSPIASEAELDDLREQRFLWKADQHHLPNRRTWKFQDLRPEIQHGIQEIAIGKLQGRPVLLFFDSLSRWTLLTTRELVSLDKALLRSMRIDDMSSIGPASRRKDGAKSNWEYLKVVDQQGNEVIFWVPCGSEAYAIWNILLPHMRQK